jgi:hypothetical protein
MTSGMIVRQSSANVDDARRTESKTGAIKSDRNIQLTHEVMVMKND